MNVPQVYVINPLEDIFPDSPPGTKRHYDLHLARGEEEGFLVGIRAGEHPVIGLSAHVECDAPGVSWNAKHIGLVPFSKNTIHIGSRSIRAKAPGLLPEYYMNDEKADIPANESRGIYISAVTQADTETGSYSGIVKLSGEGFAEEISFTITIHNVTIPSPSQSSFTYVNWTKLLFPENAREIYGIDIYSEEYWTYVKNCAKILKRQRQNMINIDLQHILLYNLGQDSDGQLIFDYTMFDRFAEIMLNEEYLGAKYLCGMHLLARDWMLDPVPNCSWNQRPLIGWIFEKQPDGSFRQVWKPASDPSVERFHRQLFSSLSKHLIEKGWDSKWAQHVADEIDNDIHYQQTLAVYQLIHQYMPNARTIDAVRRESPYTFGRELDIHVPLLWHYDMAPFAYDAINDGKTEVWQYTCLQPQFDYLSRLGDYPLISTRLLGWYNFKHGLRGFLHYAWNNYNVCRQRFNPFADASCFNSFPCDAFIVYPDRNNLTVLESVRSTAMRDSFEDYELLLLASKKHPDTVKRLVQTVINTADDFVRNTDFLMELRVRLLEIASS